MFPFKCLWIFGGTIGVSALGVAVGVPIWMSTGGGHSLSTSSSKPSTQKIVVPKIQDYDPKRTCYKWIIDRQTSGELAACEDKSKTGQDFPLFFVLWWLKEGEGYNIFTEVDSIKVESSNQISFTFPSGNSPKPERKLTIKEGYPSLNNLNSLNGKKLKDICKIEGSELSCDSGKYKSKFENVTWRFYLSRG